ncbi:MAG: DUF305 domain-containing protein [Actinobacteria bacterium]|nr:DUF305 domain-containing protein [Actinomycetota bacterium]NBT49459.1 DUF305 domain-containing protein [Actinomycetota bacterium]
MFKKLALISALVLLLTGCGMVSVTDANHTDHNMTVNNSDYSANDVMFAQMMIPHHQQAIDMSTIAMQKTTNQEVRKLAEKIKSEQLGEIATMQSWLEKAGQSGSGMMDHQGMGMLNDEEIRQLRIQTGVQFDALFLQGMMKHHKGAIGMANPMLESDNAEVRSFAEKLTNDQKTEITIIKQLLAILH